MKENRILRVIAKMLIPFTLLYALYVQFHGDFGPGGGFQAGVIFAAALVLYGLVFGVNVSSCVIEQGVLRFFTGFGVLLYVGVGIFPMLLGGEFLDYDFLAHDPVHGQHLGIFLIELGVGITVAAVMFTIFIAFASRGED